MSYVLQILYTHRLKAPLFGVLTVELNHNTDAVWLVRVNAYTKGLLSKDSDRTPGDEWIWITQIHTITTWMCHCTKHNIVTIVGQAPT